MVVRDVSRLLRTQFASLLLVFILMVPSLGMLACSRPQPLLGPVGLFTRDASDLATRPGDLGAGWKVVEAAAAEPGEAISVWQFKLVDQNSEWVPALDGWVGVYPVYPDQEVARTVYENQRLTSPELSDPGIGDESIFSKPSRVMATLLFRKSNVVVWLQGNGHAFTKPDQFAVRAAREIEKRIYELAGPRPAPARPAPSNVLASKSAVQLALTAADLGEGWRLRGSGPVSRGMATSAADFLFFGKNAVGETEFEGWVANYSSIASAREAYRQEKLSGTIMGDPGTGDEASMVTTTLADVTLVFRKANVVARIWVKAHPSVRPDRIAVFAAGKLEAKIPGP